MSIKEAAETLRSWGVYGGLAVLGGVFGSFVWSQAADDAEIPRLIHSHFLMSDEALALTLERGRGSGDSPLNKQIFRELQHHLNETEQTRNHLREVANRHSVRSYSGSRTYVRHLIPLVSVRCLVLSDPTLRQLLVDRRDNTNREDLNCSGAQNEGVSAWLPFADFSPLVLPFFAEVGDTVVLSVHIDSRRIELNGEASRLANGDELVRAFMYPKTELTFGAPVRENYLSKQIEIPKGRSDHYVSISLNERGQNSVYTTSDSDENNHAPYVISIFATVTVTPS